MSLATKLSGAIKGLRTLMTRTKAKPLLAVKNIPRQQIRKSSDEFTQPFENMPFNVTNRYALSIVFALFFGIPFWAPFLIIYYMYLKKSL